MTNAFIFPGQGSQTVGMGLDLYNNFEVAKRVFQEVDEALHQKLSTLMFEGDANELMQTQNAQPAIMSVGMAAVRVLEQETGKKIADIAAFSAGHSLGEYTALCAAGALDITQTAQLLRQRGLAMAEASVVNPGAMAAILALQKDQVQDIIAHTNLGGKTCVVANDNCPGQVVISGHDSAVEAVMAECLNKGAKRAIKLAVSGGFHSPLMQAAADKMTEVLKGFDIKTPVVPVMANATAKPVQDPTEIKQLLIRQITGSVLWTDSLRYMIGQGVTQFVECGNGKVLAGLVKKTDAEKTVVSVGSSADLEAALAILK